jgi:hypothetical protein
MALEESAHTGVPLYVGKLLGRSSYSRSSHPSVPLYRYTHTPQCRCNGAEVGESKPRVIGNWRPRRHDSRHRFRLLRDIIERMLAGNAGQPPKRIIDASKRPLIATQQNPSDREELPTRLRGTTHPTARNLTATSAPDSSDEPKDASETKTGSTSNPGFDSSRLPVRYDRTQCRSILLMDFNSVIVFRYGDIRGVGFGRTNRRLQSGTHNPTHRLWVSQLLERSFPAPRSDRPVFHPAPSP